MLAFIHALEKEEVKRYAYVGIFLGLGLFLKEMMVLWLPVFAWELASRKGARVLLSRGPALALVIMLTGAMPDVIWNLFESEQGDSLSERGLVQQVARFGMGWSLGPISLFSRPLVAPLGEAVSEYPALSLVPGLVLLSGALVAFRHLRSPDVRLWLRLGWCPFIFFTLGGNPNIGNPEFWWSDLSVVPFAMLTAVTLTRLSPSILALGLLLSVPGAFNVLHARENCYPSSLTSTRRALESCLNSQRVLVAHFKERDFGELTVVGSFKMPAAAHYARWGGVYAERLADPAPPTGHIPWPVIDDASRTAEQARMTRMLHVLQTR